MRIDLLALLLFVVCVSPSSSAQVINACARNNNGALRIVSDPADCSSRETPISWNQQGPQGDAGEPGTAGEPGSDAAVLFVFDVNGAELGIFLGGNSFFHEPSEVIIAEQRDGSLDPPSAPTVLYESKY